MNTTHFSIETCRAPVLRTPPSSAFEALRAATPVTQNDLVCKSRKMIRDEPLAAQIGGSARASQASADYVA